MCLGNDAFSQTRKRPCGKEKPSLAQPFYDFTPCFIEKQEGFLYFFAVLIQKTPLMCHITCHFQGNFVLHSLALKKRLHIIQQTVGHIVTSVIGGAALVRKQNGIFALYHE